MAAFKDRTGEIYGNWEVINYSHKERLENKRIRHFWNCKNIKTGEEKKIHVLRLLNLRESKERGYNREDYLKHREKRIANTLKYYYENKEKRAKQMRAYYDNNLEKLREYGREYTRKYVKETGGKAQKEYYERNKEFFREYHRRYREIHKEKIQQYHTQYYLKKKLSKTYTGKLKLKILQFLKVIK